MRKILISLFLLSLILMMNSVTAVPSGNYYKQITIDHTYVNGSQTDFPIMINISDDDLISKAQPDGDDIVFFAYDNITQLDHEIELYNSSAGHLVAWVKIPELSGTENITIYMYYNNSEATNQQNAIGVWDSNYVGVWHMLDGADALHINDSTDNGNDGTKLGSGEPFETNGKINSAQGFDGSDDYISLTDIDLSTITISAIVKLDNNTIDEQIISRKGELNWWFAVYENKFYFGGGFPTWFQVGSDTSPTTDTWYYVVGVFDDTNDKIMLYVDGVYEGFEITTGDATQNDLVATIGSNILGTRNFNGTIDEVRLSNTVRSHGWIETTYNNTYSPSTFSTLGAEQTTDDTPPAGITYLENSTYEQTYLNWTWTDPVDSDFSKVMVYLDGLFKVNITSGVQCYNATSLTSGTTYEIGTKTVDTTGNINHTWVNHSATTAPATTYTTPEFVNITIDGTTSIIFANHSDSTIEGNWISLSGGDPIKLPSPFTLTYNGTNFSSSTNGRINVTVDVENYTDYIVTYPYTTHDMFTDVSGENDVSMCFNGTTYFAENHVDVYLVKISLTSLKDAFYSITEGDITGFQYLLYSSNKTNGLLNDHGDMDLNFGEVDAGDYAIFILLNNSDSNKMSILSATTFQVLEYDSTTTVLSPEVTLGSTFDVNINLTDAPTDISYTYGAVLMHEDAYRAEMQLKFNGTRAGTNLTLNGVDIIQGYVVLGVGLSSVNITTVLDTISDGIDAENGSVMNTTIMANNTSIAFNTGELKAGNYILLTGVYNSDEKLVAFNQSEILISTDITNPVVTTVTLNDSTTNTGDAILVTVIATDNVEVTNVTIGRVELTPQSGDTWNGTIIAIEGIQYVNVSAKDAAGNTGWNNSTIYTATTDITPPTINITSHASGYTTTASSITVKGYVNGTGSTPTVIVNGYTATLDLVDYAGTYSVSIPLSRIGTKTITAIATDASGNNESTSITVTRRSTGGGGGGGGGGSSGEAYENIALKNAVRLYLSVNNPVEYTFTDELNSIRNVAFTPLANKGYTSVVIEVLRNTSGLVSTPAPGLVYQNMNIWVGLGGWANEQTVSNAEIHFRVDKNWLKQNNVDYGDIVLVKHHGEKWAELPTTKTSDDSGYVYYSVKTTEFSPFAIIAKTVDGVKVTVPPIEPEVPDETEPTDSTPLEGGEEEEETDGIPGFEAIGAFGMIAAVYFMHRRRE